MTFSRRAVFSSLLDLSPRIILLTSCAACVKPAKTSRQPGDSSRDLVGGHQQPLSSGHVFTTPKGHKDFAPKCCFLFFVRETS